MSEPLLLTKLRPPPPRPKVVSRPRLVKKLNEGYRSRLTLISASAGFGKTTLVADWLATCPRPVAWLSLDEGDSDVHRFLAYLIAAFQTITPQVGEEISAMLESPRPPPWDVILAILLNAITLLPDDFTLVLDDYHLIDSKPIDQILTFLLDHQPPQMHVMIISREDPSLPVARLRARGQLCELRDADLRFTLSEAAEFLTEGMGLSLSSEEIAALEARTEGWIAGLQLAALSMRGLSDTTGFVQSFTGSHHFVMDYLLEEVLGRQPDHIQQFLLHTSLLDRLSGSLCDAMMESAPLSGQETLEALEHANLFIIPLDDERRWFRYHHLFAELLRQRLQMLYSPQPHLLAQFHTRASQWYEENGFEFEAFRHAVAANDLESAERLSRAGRMPLHSLAVVTAILKWLDSLPDTVMDARPWLWTRSALATLMSGHITGVEEKLKAAEKTIHKAALDDHLRDLIGQIAAIRATLAVLHYQPETAVLQSRRALECLHPDNKPYRSRAIWAQGVASQLQGDRITARQLFTEAVQQASGNTYHTVLASASLAQIQEADNQLYQAAETYRRSLQMLSDQGPPNASEEYIGLARIHYEWNELGKAEQYGHMSLQLARQYDRALDRAISCEVFLARLKLARGDTAGAAAMLLEIEQSVRQNNFLHRLSELASVQILVSLKQGNLTNAARLAQLNDLPLSRARVYLAWGDAAKALAVLEPFRQEMETKGWQYERLKGMILQLVALYALGEKDKAILLLDEVLLLAEPGGFIRSFVDEGEPMRRLIAEYCSRFEKQEFSISRSLTDYTLRLLAAFDQPPGMPYAQGADSQFAILEPLSQRELEILKLISQGLSNREIGERLFLALDTVKGHNRRIFDKLQVQRRTEAVARARRLGLI